LRSTDAALTEKQITALRKAGLDRAGKRLAARLGKAYKPAATSGQITGKFTRHVDLADGRYAVLERERKFTLVKWRQVMERGRGLAMTGRVSGGKISWKFEAQRGRGMIR